MTSLWKPSIGSVIIFNSYMYIMSNKQRLIKGGDKKQRYTAAS